jgi:WD40 repeat protein
MSSLRTRATTRRLSARVVITAAAVALSLGAWKSAGVAKAASLVQAVWQAELKHAFGLVLQDVSPSGVMLTFDWYRTEAGSSRPPLNLWSVGETAPSTVINLPEWPAYKGELPPIGIDCKFTADGDRIVCAHGPWLALIDIQTKKEIQCVLGTRGFFGVKLSAADVDKMPRSQAVVAVDSKDGRVAVAYNTLKNPQILVFSRYLRTRVAGWKALKYVQGLFWSPDGKRLGVLYYNTYEPSYNQREEWRNRDPEVAFAGVPDVSIFDVSSRKELLSFATGGFEAKATFSPDGKLIYVIAHCRVFREYARGSDWTKDTLRAFSSTTGKLVRAFKVKGTGVRDNFAVSPDGDFIAADCNKDVHSPLYYNLLTLLTMREDLSDDVNAGFVILDTSSGRLIFRETQRMVGAVSSSLPLFFSAKGGLLIANFGRTSNRVAGQLLAYSISP